MNELTSLWLCHGVSSGRLHRLCKLLQSAGNKMQSESHRATPIPVVELPAGTTAEALTALIEAAARSALHDLRSPGASASVPAAPARPTPIRRRARWPETTTPPRGSRRCARPHRSATSTPRPASRPSGWSTLKARGGSGARLSGGDARAGW